MQTIKKILLALIAVIGISIYLKQPQNDPVSNQKKFIVGTAGGYAPFVSINAQGEYEGFDIDISKALAQNMDMELEIKDLGSMSSLFIALEQGKIDAIIWALSITQERLNKVTMIKYQGDTSSSYPIMFWKEIPNNASSINELEGATICAEAGSCQEAVLNKYPFINKLPINHVDDGLLNIQYQKADGVLVEQAIAAKFQRKYPEIKVLNVPLAPEDQIQGIGIAIKKNNIELTENVQKVIMTLEKNGTIANLEQKWNIRS